MNSALSALAGAVIGGLLSVFASWLSQRVQTRAQCLAQETRRRQKLYNDFVELAVHCHADALQQNELNVGRLAKLYIVVDRMRLTCSDRVLQEAYSVIHGILDAYRDPNRSEAEILDLLAGDSIDLLADFADACRADIGKLQPHLARRAGTAAFRPSAAGSSGFAFESALASHREPQFFRSLPPGVEAL
jgi:hypothetical protein